MSKNTQLRARVRRIISSAIVTMGVQSRGCIMHGADILKLADSATSQALINLESEGIVFRSKPTIRDVSHAQSGVAEGQS